MDPILTQLRNSGYKLTPQRTEILRILRGSKKPMSALEVHEELRVQYPHISLDTVYRNLTLFTSIGMVSHINLQNPGSALFEFQGSEHHHHAVCLNCHRSFCIQNCPFPAPQAVEVDGQAGEFQVLSHAFEVYGYCDRCKVAESDQKEIELAAGALGRK